jgi:hypothetical protein
MLIIIAESPPWLYQISRYLGNAGLVVQVRRQLIAWPREPLILPRVSFGKFVQGPGVMCPPIIYSGCKRTDGVIRREFSSAIFEENYSAASLTETSQTGFGLRIRLDFCRKGRIAMGVGQWIWPPADALRARPAICGALGRADFS